MEKPKVNPVDLARAKAAADPMAGYPRRLARDILADNAQLWVQPVQYIRLPDTAFHQLAAGNPMRFAIGFATDSTNGVRIGNEDNPTGFGGGFLIDTDWWEWFNFRQHGPFVCLPFYGADAAGGPSVAVIEVLIQP